MLYLFNNGKYKYIAIELKKHNIKCSGSKGDRSVRSGFLGFVNSVNEGGVGVEGRGPGSVHGKDSGRSGGHGSGGGSLGIIAALLGGSVGCVSGFQGGEGSAPWTESSTVSAGQIHTLYVFSLSLTTFVKIHHLIVGSSFVCIGSVVGRLRSRLASLSGLGGSGLGNGVGVGGDDGGRG